MTINEKHVWSNLAVHPGDTLREEIEFIGMSQKELAVRMGRPAQAVNEIIRGKKAITHETALALETVLDIPAQFWINLQTIYAGTLARNAEKDKLAQQVDRLKAFRMTELENREWVPRVQEKTEKVKELCRFLGVASLDEYQGVCLGAFRITGGNTYSPEALAVWLRKGELDAQKLELPPYDSGKFKSAVGQIRGITSKGPEEFLPEMRELCGAAGVALVLTRDLPKSGANGVARWLNPSKPMIQLSLRWRWADVFWFTFFHEAGHLLKHRRDVFVDYAKPQESKPPEELEADRFAADILIPPEKLKKFLQRESFRADAVESFADCIGVHPGIVAGRLEHEGYVRYGSLNGIKQRYHWAD